MKNQGFWIMRFVVAIIVIFVLAYMGYHVYDALNVPYRTTTVVLMDTEEAFSATGVFVRDELVLDMPGGVMLPAVSDGDRISAGQTVGTVYSDPDAMRMHEQLEALKSRAEQLDYVARRSAATLDVSGLDQQIRQRLIQFMQTVDQKKFAGLEKESLELKALLFKREVSVGKGSDISAMQADLTEQIALLSQSVSHQSSVVLAPASGVFCSAGDGLETVWTPESVQSMDVASFMEAYAKEPVFPEGNTGRLAQGLDWYLAVLIPSEHADKLTVGGQIQVRFHADKPETFSMRVVRFSPEADGKRVLVLGCQKYLAQFVSLRELAVDLVFSDYSGLRIPREAVHIEDGKPYVFCLVASQIVQKEIHIIGDIERENYYLARYDPLNTRGLLPSDEVVVAGKDLYDGKIIR